MKNSTINKTNCLRTTLLLAIGGLLAFTGCTGIDGTAGYQTATKNHVASYLEQKTVDPVDQEPDPTYEWFY